MKTKQAINETGYGWITPSGKIVATNHYMHMSADILEQMADDLPDFSDIEAELEECEAGCQELEDAEGSVNAEWHVYETACDDAASDKIHRMMHAGFIRVGTRTGEGWVYFEGTSQARARLGQALVRVTAMFGRGLAAFKYEEWKR